jgi:hypothetical protein
MRTSMRRHCLSRPTWRPSVVAERNGCSALRAMLLSALLGEPTLFGDSVHYGIHLFGLHRGAAIFRAASPPSGGWTKFAWRSHLFRSEARSGRRSCALRAFMILALDHLLLLSFYPAPSLSSLSRYACAPVRVVERFVYFPTHP